jgi:folate-dependent phosphoribosylglycinamide formyltransferase PurN
LIRIGILLDSLTVQAWQGETIRQIMHTQFAEITLLIVNQQPKPSGKPSPFIYKAYRKLDRILFKTELDAFSEESIFSSLESNTKQLLVNPKQKKYSDYFESEDIAQIKSENLDVLLRFGFRILKGDILNTAKFGIWSFHHGDPEYYRGGPPAFWEVMNAQNLTGSVLMQLNDSLDQGKILYQSLTQTDPLSVQRNANRIFWNSAFFVARVLNQIRMEGEESGLRSLENKELPPKSQLLTPPDTLKMAKLWAKLLIRNSSRKIQESIRKPHWEVGFVKKEDWDFSQPLNWKSIKILKNPKSSQTFWADPFPVKSDHGSYVFLEEWDKRRKKGRILLWEEGREPRMILEEPWHLSYPFLWKEKDQFYLIPESTEAGKLYRYEAKDFPQVWNPREEFFSAEAYDPTIWKTDEGYWLFVNQKPHPAASPFDELYLYFSETWENPVWKPHPQNPIVSDVRKSRPAGSLFVRNGKLYRPAQDSELRYGHRIRIQEVIQLDKNTYREQEAYILNPPVNAGILGMHTINFTEDSVYLDFYSRR